MLPEIRFDILTLFPELFTSLAGASILKRAIEAGRVEVVLHDIRQYAADSHRTVDDAPYGGGAGMVMKAEPVVDAVKSVPVVGKRCLTVFLTPSGDPLTQKLALELAGFDQLVFLCGHYEGIDERAVDLVIDREISVGDYVLTGGELPAMVMCDVISRLVKGVLGNTDSVHEESFSNDVLEYPHYTRPTDFKGLKVPGVLLSGHHDKIERWRQDKALERTGKRRPDLLKKESI